MNKIGRIIILSLMSLGACNITVDSTNRVLKNVANSNKTKEAILYVKEAGATVGDSYQISIKDYGRTLSDKESGNVLVVDSDHGKSPLDSNSVRIEWLNDDTLQIEFDSSLRSFSKETKALGVSIIYVRK